ncbi:MAG: hypothetical protein AMJ65_06820 [Phycisphaerae bacterium SG8_4]|nr:MAG: hypothetical protein AMJ65_06820 [Phycisphaerae bacterium SG8_4]
MTDQLDVTGAHDALEAFLVASFRDRDYAAAAEATQITWLNVHTSDIPGAIANAMRIVVPIDYEHIECTVLHTAKVFSEVMVDVAFVIVASSEKWNFRYEGTARVIREEDYMKPSPDGLWGVNPASMARGQRQMTPTR